MANKTAEERPGFTCVFVQ